MENEVWVFNGEGGRFPGGVFSSVERAEECIAKYRLTGILTRYPVDVSVYDWTIQRGSFKPKTERQQSPEFIQRFSSAYTGHYHYENGKQSG